MSDEPIMRAEHEEFCKRVEAASKRQDKRIELLEANVREISALTANVERLATNIESMVREQEKQGKRLEALEGRDGEKWRKAMGYVGTAVVSAVIGFVLSQIGIV